MSSWLSSLALNSFDSTNGLAWFSMVYNEVAKHGLWSVPAKFAESGLRLVVCLIPRLVPRQVGWRIVYWVALPNCSSCWETGSAFIGDVCTVQDVGRRSTHRMCGGVTFEGAESRRRGVEGIDCVREDCFALEYSVFIAEMTNNTQIQIKGKIKSSKCSKWDVSLATSENLSC